MTFVTTNVTLQIMWLSQVVSLVGADWRRPCGARRSAEPGSHGKLADAQLLNPLERGTTAHDSPAVRISEKVKDAIVLRFERKKS